MLEPLTSPRPPFPTRRMCTGGMMLSGLILVACVSISEVETVEADLARAATEFERTSAKTAELKDTVSLLSAAVAELEAENTALMKTAQYLWGQAIDRLRTNESNATPETADKLDMESVAAFQEIVHGFPKSPLVKHAADRIMGLEHKIEVRTREVARAQAGVRRLIRSCAANAKAASNVQTVRWNYAGNVDLNFGLAQARKRDAYSAKAEAAKGKALEMLNDVPDPDGSLEQEVEGCVD